MAGRKVGIPSLATIRQTTPQGEKLQEAIRAVVGPIQKMPIVSGVLHEGVALSPTAVDVAHGLGRAYRGVVQASHAPGVGDVLFSWNGRDLSQFDDPIVVATAGTDLTAAVTVVDSAIPPGTKAIRLKATGTLANGRDAMLLMRIKAAELELRDVRRYVARMRIGDHKVASPTQQCVIGPAFLSGGPAGAPYANLVGPLDGFGTPAAALYRLDGASLVTGLSIHAWFEPDSGGAVGDGAYLEVEVIGKQASGAAPTWRVIGRGAGSSDTAESVLNKSHGSWAIAAMPAAWNGLAIDRAGLAMAVDANGAGVTDPFYEICEFAILSHPADRFGLTEEPSRDPAKCIRLRAGRPGLYDLWVF